MTFPMNSYANYTFKAAAAFETQNENVYKINLDEFKAHKAIHVLNALLRQLLAACDTEGAMTSTCGHLSGLEIK